jgi:hypothetical protein
MRDHVEASELEAFVIGALDGERLERFEAHLASCESCAARLAREAALEVALVEVQAAAAKPRRRRFASNAAWTAPVLVVAVIAAIALRRGADRDDRQAILARPRPQVVCADGPDQVACVDDAHRHGLFVQYPTWADSPPLGNRDPNAGPWSAPFAEDGP